jgi:biofilm PGA synthesis N-glycosyltransferase PgaC
MTSRSYVLISPCRDEEACVRATLDTVLAQTAPPALWVIVDDGSTDRTPEILAEYAARHDFIRVVRREDRGERSVGPGVIEAFYAGLETVDLDQFEYLCKLDLDLELPPGYFEELMRRMEVEPRLGSCSGKAYYRAGSRLISERIGDEVAVGASKFYRVACFQQIGGFVRQVMWDGIDTHHSRQLGWKVRSWDDEGIRFIHLRPMGSSHKGILAGRSRWGFGQYFMGTGLAYITASAVFRMTRPPLVLGGLAIWWGWVRSARRGERRYGDRAFRCFLRRYQWECLLQGKERATMRLEARQAQEWKPGRSTTGVTGRQEHTMLPQEAV